MLDSDGTSVGVGGGWSGAIYCFALFVSVICTHLIGSRAGDVVQRLGDPLPLGVYQTG